MAVQRLQAAQSTLATNMPRRLLQMTLLTLNISLTANCPASHPSYCSRIEQIVRSLFILKSDSVIGILPASFRPGRHLYWSSSWRNAMLDVEVHSSALFSATCCPPKTRRQIKRTATGLRCPSSSLAVIDARRCGNARWAQRTRQSVN